MAHGANKVSYMIAFTPLITLFKWADEFMPPRRLPLSLIFVSQRFSCRGIKVVVDYFLARGHEKSTIKVYIPQWRQNPNHPHNHIDDAHLLDS